MAEAVFNQRKPRFCPPPGACDAHCHVYDASPRFPAHGGERLLALHRHLGIERGVIVQANRDSRAVTLAALGAGGSRYRGIALVDDGTSEPELRALHEAGIRGVRFTFTARHGGVPDLAAVRRVLDGIRLMGWHVDFLIGPEDMLGNFDFFRAITIPFVFDHMGRIDARAGLDQPAFKALQELVKRDNGWVKLSGADRLSVTGQPFHDALPYAQALIAAAPDRVLWGTDWPHPNNPFDPDDADLVDLLPLIAPDERARRKLLVDNPARLFGFAP